MSIQEEKRSSWVSVVGLPNAGKSTLFNRIMGGKLAIATPKAQTTRNTLKGIKTVGNCQLVFIDTPGLVSPQNKMDKLMCKALSQTFSDADHILLIHDASKPISGQEENLLKILQGKTCSLVLNKVDKINKVALLEKAREFQERYDFSHIFMISALKNQGVNKILDTMQKEAVHPGWFFAEDQEMIAPRSFLAQEMLREKILLNTNQEVPYKVFLDTELYEEEANIIKIHITIYVLTEGQKKIILGQKGQLIKKISTQARYDLEKIFGKKIFLKAFIKKRDWEKHLSERNFINF